MSIVLTAEELHSLTGYKRPADQLRVLHQLGFSRARRSGPAKQVILERAHFDAVKAGTGSGIAYRPIVLPTVRPRTAPSAPYPWDQRTALYRHFDAAGKILYIGIAVDPDKRAGEHRREQAWAKRAVRVEIEWFDTRREAMAAERRAIASEAPAFNVLHQKRKGGNR